MLTGNQIKKLDDLVNYAMEDYRALLAAHGDPPGSVVDVVKKRHFDALRDLLRSFNTEPPQDFICDRCRREGVAPSVFTIDGYEGVCTDCANWHRVSYPDPKRNCGHYNTLYRIASTDSKKKDNTEPSLKERAERVIPDYTAMTYDMQISSLVRMQRLLIDIAAAVDALREKRC